MAVTIIRGWGIANNRREDGTYLGPMLIAPFMCQVFCVVLDYRETSGLGPAVGGWLPAGDLYGMWFGLVTEYASFSLISHDSSCVIMTLQSEFGSSCLAADVQATWGKQEYLWWSSRHGLSSRRLESLSLSFPNIWSQHMNEERSWGPT